LLQHLKCSFSKIGLRGAFQILRESLWLLLKPQHSFPKQYRTECNMNFTKGRNTGSKV